MDKKNLNKKKFSPKLGGNKSKPPFNPYWIYSIIIIGLLGMFFFGGNVSVKEVTWSQFQEYVNEDRVKKVVVYSRKDNAEAVVREGSVRHIFKENADKVKANPSIIVTIPSADKAAEFLDKVKEEKVPAVLKMELSNDDIANAIAEATGTEVKVFYSCHNLSAEDFESGETYLSMMQKNVETLKEVLNGWR